MYRGSRRGCGRILPPVRWRDGRIVYNEVYAHDTPEQPVYHANLEILRPFYEAFNRRDYDALLRYLDPEVALYPAVPLPDADTEYLGHVGMREFIRIAFETWTTVTVEPREMVEAAGER